jgi:hypothetical protein
MARTLRHHALRALFRLLLLVVATAAPCARAAFAPANTGEQTAPEPIPLDAPRLDALASPSCFSIAEGLLDCPARGGAIITFYGAFPSSLYPFFRRPFAAQSLCAVHAMTLKYVTPCGEPLTSLRSHESRVALLQCRACARGVCARRSRFQNTTRTLSCVRVATPPLHETSHCRSLNGCAHCTHEIVCVVVVHTHTHTHILNTGANFGARLSRVTRVRASFALYSRNRVSSSKQTFFAHPTFLS